MTVSEFVILSRWPVCYSSLVDGSAARPRFIGEWSDSLRTLHHQTGKSAAESGRRSVPW